jgi:hypothetical protein
MLGITVTTVCLGVGNFYTDLNQITFCLSVYHC